MAELVKAFGDFVAALLSLAGFVGRPRRRAGIIADLDLLGKLDETPEFGAGSWPHTWLSNYLTLQIAEYSGLDLRTSRRAIKWPSVIVATLIWVPLAWLTYHLVDIGHAWYAAIPGVPSGLFFLSTVGLLLEKEEVIPADAAAVGEDRATAFDSDENTDH